MMGAWALVVFYLATYVDSLMKKKVFVKQDKTIDKEIDSI